MYKGFSRFDAYVTGEYGEAVSYFLLDLLMVAPTGGGDCLGALRVSASRRDLVRSYGAVADSFIAGVVPPEYHGRGSCRSTFRYTGILDRERRPLRAQYDRTDVCGTRGICRGRGPLSNSIPAK